MNSIRSAILSGETPRPSSPIARKQKHGSVLEPGSLSGIPIKREQSRSIDQRREDRHSNIVESAVLHLRGDTIEVSVINVSAGGLMIECDGIDPQIGEAVEIEFPDCNPTSCHVRWLRGKRVGVEFVEETTIIGSASVQAFVIRSLRGEAAIGETSDDDAPMNPNRPARHRLIWIGTIHSGEESTPVRVRNISTDGAMVECDWDFHIGSELQLDLEDAGRVFATVRWCEGGHLGLKFNSRFDLRALAKSEPAPEKRPPPSAGPEAGPLGPIPMGDIEIRETPPKSPGRMSLAEIADLYGRGTTMR